VCRLCFRGTPQFSNFIWGQLGARAQGQLPPAPSGAVHVWVSMRTSWPSARAVDCCYLNVIDLYWGNPFFLLAIAYTRDYRLWNLPTSATVCVGPMHAVRACHIARYEWWSLSQAYYVTLVNTEWLHPDSLVGVARSCRVSSRPTADGVFPHLGLSSWLTRRQLGVSAKTLRPYPHPARCAEAWRREPAILMT